MHIDFSAAFDRVNLRGILYKLYSVGIGISVLFILKQFLSNRSQHVMADGCRSNLVNVVSECRLEVFWACFLFTFLYFFTLEPFSILENKLIGEADDSTLIAVLPSPGVPVW